MLAPLRWLLIPLAVGLFAVVGLALSVQNPPAQLDQPTGFEQTEGSESSDRTRPEPTPDGDAAGSDGVTAGPIDESTGDASVDGTVDVEVAAPAGGVGIDLGSPVPVVLSEDGTATPLDAGSLAGGAGLRLGDGGTLDPLPASAGIAPSDLVVAPAPADGGVDLLRPDGARVEIRSAGGPGPDGGNAPVSVTEVDGSGTATPLRPDAAGRIDLGDGVTVEVSPSPDTNPSSGDGTGPSNDPEDGRSWIRWLAVAATTGVLAGALVLLYRRRDSPAAGDGPASEPEPPIDLGRLADLIERLARDGDPARAVRLAFYAAGRGVGTLPARRSTETPAEWYHRSVETQPHLAPPLNVLCNAFAAVRFAPTAPTLADRDEAVGALRQLHHLATDPETIAVYDRPSDTPLAGAGRR